MCEKKKVQRVMKKMVRRVMKKKEEKVDEGIWVKRGSKKRRSEGVRTTRAAAPYFSLCFFVCGCVSLW